jgi:hypothetical protein
MSQRLIITALNNLTYVLVLIASANLSFHCTFPCEKYDIQSSENIYNFNVTVCYIIYIN